MDAKDLDLDETRRLLYGALAAGLGTERYNLIGTLTNALIHHSGLKSDAETLLAHLVGVVNGGYPTAWVYELIAEITDLLAEDGPASGH